MDVLRKLTRRDTIRFLRAQADDLADWLAFFAPRTATRYVEERQDELAAFVRRWQYELEGDYTDDTV